MTDELQKEWEKVGPEPPDPTEADSVSEAVFIGEQESGQTVAVGREDTEEWIVVENMTLLDVGPEP